MTGFSAADVNQTQAHNDIAPKILTLLQDSFAYMEGRIDPPSSLHRLTIEAIQKHIKNEVLLSISHADTPIACAFLTKQPDALYIGKLATKASLQGRGAAKALIDWAETFARDQGLNTLRLQTRIELTENHAIFAHYGFVKTAEGTHPGFTRPTEITMEKYV